MKDISKIVPEKENELYKLDELYNFKNFINLINLINLMNFMNLTNLMNFMNLTNEKSVVRWGGESYNLIKSLITYV
ncbi:hypothetical protein CO083_05150 [Candidatus Roizmanbacteria bacterium CG_4_9_14_0_8_um_filter_34_12]|uniref:Uncharacterized protein n=1 Tax=Candidatus Roizmanbacteria bacterium CG_4_9_14_0_8_um_filter_34_12 TaxID=1974840 RepID=A0A2M8DBK2_9BACT|nr:MAG: hypothetical protein CO083_05150 [Candidatus Roizmanbacteria bacterium CG_4_9_14_0_8_um_filter_34_12]